MKKTITLLLMCFYLVGIYGQNTDSWNAIPWCEYEITGTNNIGGGDSLELTAYTSGQLDQEHNSSWYIFTVITSGDLYIFISPENTTNNFDFALWGPGYTIPPTVPPLRCNAAKYPMISGCGTNDPYTGMDPAGFTTCVDSCNNEPTSIYLTVTAGQSFILLVDNNTPDTSQIGGFLLQALGTAEIGCNFAIDESNNNSNNTIVSTTILDAQGKVINKSSEQLSTGIYFIIDRFANGKFRSTKKFIQ